MINILVTITVSEQNRPQTLRLLEQLTEASQQENGNISYQHYLHPTRSRSSTDSRGRSSFLAASERDRNPESTE